MDNYTNFNGTYGSHYHLHAQMWTNWSNASYGAHGQSSVHLRVYLAKDSGYNHSGLGYFNAQGRVNGAQVATGTFPTTLGTGGGTWIAIDWDGTYDHDVNGNLGLSNGASSQASWSGIGSAGGDWGTYWLPRLGRGPTITDWTADTIKTTSARLGTEISNYGNGTVAAARMYYRIQSTGGWSNTSDANDVGGYNYWTVTGLKPGKTYEYYVLWWNNNGDTTQSAARTFKTKPLAGITPLLIGLT